VNSPSGHLSVYVDSMIWWNPFNACCCQALYAREQLSAERLHSRGARRSQSSKTGLSPTVWAEKNRRVEYEAKSHAGELRWVESWCISFVRGVLSVGLVKNSARVLVVTTRRTFLCKAVTPFPVWTLFVFALTSKDGVISCTANQWERHTSDAKWE